MCRRNLIEFEKSLSAKLKEAEGQLREYVAGTWQLDKDTRRSLIAIASDGVNWNIYRPVLLAGAKPTPETVTLQSVASQEILNEIKQRQGTSGRRRANDN